MNCGTLQGAITYQLGWSCVNIMSVNLSREEQKAVIKEAITEWLDGQIMKFGWNVLGWGLATTLAVITYFFLISQGWRRN